MEMLEQLWHYNNWANPRLFLHFERYGEQVPKSSLQLLSHIVNTQAHWLSRIKAEPATVGVWEEHDLETCKKLQEATAAELRELTQGPLTDVVHYRNTQGQQFSNTLFDILLHVFNHSTYHRAQIAMDMRTKGLEPLNTDYIGMVR